MASELWTASDLERLAEGALGVAGAEEVEVVVRADRRGLARFAHSEVHQHVTTEHVGATVRVALAGGRLGVVAVETDDPAEVRRAVEEAVALARLVPPAEGFAGFAPPQEVPGTVAFDEDAAASTAAQRVAGVRHLLAALPDGYEAAGAYDTVGSAVGVFTSRGQRVTCRSSLATVATVVTGPSSTGYAESGGRALADVDTAGTGERAAAKAVAAADPTELDAGAYPVVLEPAAVATLVQFLAVYGFNGRAFLEGRACTTGRLGAQALDPRVSIVDEPASAASTGLPFDAEGTPTRRLDLVRQGVLAAVAHDRATGARAGTGSTGHALPAPNTFGPVPTSARLEPGDGGSVEDLVAGLERGLVVTRFHYTNVTHPVEVVLTGMTRDGTWLVEDGRIVRAVRNLRYRQSVLEALASVDAVSTETRFSTDLFFGGSRSAALRLPAFSFESATTF